MKKIFENKKLESAARLFRPLANFVLILFPNFSVELKQSEYKVKPITYASIALMLAFQYFFLLLVGLLVVFYIFELLELNYIIFSIILSLLILVFMLFNFMYMPKMYLMKRGREIDVSLLFALRHMLIKVKSGIPLFDSMVGVAYGEYGEVSKEFNDLVKDIQSGTSEVRALEKIGFNNLSVFFRRFVWQITNSLRAGTDVADTLEVIVKSLEEERYIQIKTFGSRLSPVALMYIMFTIIVPALGTTFLTIFSSFLGGNISNEVYYLIPVILLASNLMFMNIIRSIRPNFEMV